MLSILIPIYNEDVTALVSEISRQCLLIEELSYEIRLYDDGSSDEFKQINKNINYLPCIIYKELPENIGRSRIRNLLGFDAKGESLLFIDGDSIIYNDTYIINYLNNKSKVIYGGRLYNKSSIDRSTILHWKYGSKFESKSLEKRKKQPYLSFMSNNFLINKELFYSNLFDESIKEYGYEDLVFAEWLKKNTITICHIDNPVIHNKLDCNKSFIQKTEIATKSLVGLIHNNKISSTKLYEFYKKYKNVVGLLNTPFIKSFLKKNLLGMTPNLYYLQLYKLIHFHNESIKKAYHKS